MKSETCFQEVKQTSETTPATTDQRPRVVIIGGGFGGLYAAKALANRAVSVTLIDRKNHHTFQPLLYQVATSVLSPGEIAIPLRQTLAHAKNTSVMMAEVAGMDLRCGEVLLSSGAKVPFDYLIVAAGSRHSYFGNDSWEANAPGLKTIEDSTDIRRRIFSAFETAERDAMLSGSAPAPHFAIVGGGPTGVELAGAIIDVAHNAMADDFRHIDPKKIDVSIYEGGPRLLSSYSEHLSRRAKEQLEELGVTVKTNSRVENVENERLLVNGEWINADVVLWATGVSASPLGKYLGTPQDKAGRVIVEADLSIPNHPNIFAIGDMAAVTNTTGERLPGLASVAIQQGKATASNILGDLKGQERKAFRYLDKGSMATIGRGRAVVQFGRIEFSGFFARLVWGLVHVALLDGSRNRYMVVREWLWARLTRQRSARLITEGVH